MKAKKFIKNLSLTMMLISSILISGCSPTKQNDELKPMNYAVYMKDRKIYYDSLNGSAPTEIFDSKNVADAYSISGGVKITQNQNRIFYLDDMADKSLEGTLKYRNINKDGSFSEEFEIAKNVGEYKFSNDGNIVLYKNYSNEYSVYEYIVDKKEKTKLGDVSEFEVSKDGKRILFIDENGNIHEKKPGNESNVIAKETYSFFVPIQDLKTYYYLDGEDFYKKEFGKEKKYIDSYVENLLEIYETGELYYEKIEPDSHIIPIQNILNDDMKENDKKYENVDIENFRIADYPVESEYKSISEYQKAVADYEESVAYSFELSQYKLRRDYRASVEKNGGIEFAKSIFYYYDGKKSTLLGEWNVGRYEHDGEKESGRYFFTNSKSPMLFFGNFDIDTKNKVNMSELVNPYKLGISESAIMSMSKFMIAVKDKVSEFEGKELLLENLSNVEFSSDSKNIYITQITDREKYISSFYKAEIEDKAPAKPELINDDVDEFGVYPTLDGDIYYQRLDNTDWESTFWKNDTKLYQNINLEWKSDDNKEFLITHYQPSKENNETDLSKLILLKNGEEIVLSENATHPAVYKNGYIFFIENFEEKTQNGNIKYYTPDGEIKTLAENAQFLRMEYN